MDDVAITLVRIAMLLFVVIIVFDVETNTPCLQHLVGEG